MRSDAPAGTRIVYDKSALLHLRQSPLARTPPRTMPHIPGVTTAAPGAEIVSAHAVDAHQHDGHPPLAKPATAGACSAAWRRSRASAISGLPCTASVAPGMCGVRASSASTAAPVGADGLQFDMDES